jgi:hypothetical protein
MTVLVRTRAACAAALLATGALLLTGCRSVPDAVPPPAAAVNEEALAERARREACEQELAATRESLSASEAAVRSAEARAVELSSRLLEKSAELQGSTERQVALQRQLDDAVQEVVRAKAKLRSLESRADAASTMAEAEIALKALQGRGAAVNRQELDKAEDLLRMSSEEFERENYGGALFLATQAKTHLHAAEAAPAPRSAAVTEGVPFAAPLRLVVKADANVRQGPGSRFEVIGTVAKGAEVTGTARQNRWVRVTDSRGLTGWVFDELLDEP